MIQGIRHPKLVLITGSGSGIGRATALRFGKDGALVLSTDINPDTAEQTAAAIRRNGGRAESYRLDVTDDEEWRAIAALVRDEHGAPDVLVNNAGIGFAGGFLDHSKEDWDRQMAVLLDGVVNGCRAIAPLMVERRRGHIVNISSGLAFVPFALTPSYCVAKAGVRMFSECLRIELAPHHVGVTAICPGLAATGIIKHGQLVADMGVEADRRARIQTVAGTVAERYGPLVLPPDYIARGIVHAVHNNWAVVPVRPESWLGYALHRASPGLVRLVSGQIRPDRVRRLVAVADQLIPDAVIQRAESLAGLSPKEPVRSA